MKHIEDTPWWICDKDDENYCAYVDTDSNYFNAEPILKHLYPDFESYDDKDKDSKLEQVALAYQDIINEDYDRLAREAFNVTEHRLEMKTECVIRSAYFRATRRYAQWITKQEGIEKETLDIKGLEFMKANFPPILGDFFNDILQQVLKGGEKDNILNQIKVFKKQILGGKIPLVKLGNPTSVKKLDKYSGTKARAGEMFTEILKGAPAPVRAAIRYNPYKIEALAFFDYDMPDKIQDFLNIYADRQKVFESILLNKLEGFFNDLEWSLDLNPHLNALSSYEI